MRIVRVIEAAGFAGIAVALHLALFWQAPSGVLQGSGAGGSDQVSLTGMTPQIAAMLDAVDTVPEVTPTAPDIPRPAMPQLQPTALTPTAPPVPTLPTALPALETPGLALPLVVPPKPPAPPPPPEPVEAAEPATTPEPPQPDTVADPSPPEPPTQTVTASPTPQPRPDRPQAQAQAQAPRQTSTPGQKQTRAAGTGGGTVEGNDGAGETIGGTDAKTQNLLRTWFTRIAQQVQRTQGRALRSVPAQGVATVRLTVGSDGRLQSVAIVASSGQAAVDREVLTAVRQAGQFPKAPNSIGPGPHSYNIPFRVGK